MKYLKSIFLTIFLIVILVALGVYMSDWNLTNQDFVPWFYGLMALVFILILATLPKKKWQKISILLGLSAVTGCIGFFLLFFSFFKCEEKVLTIWNIDDYKISYGYSECWAGPAEEAKYKLEQRALGGLLNTRLAVIWKSQTENLVSNKTFVNDKNCILEFMNGKYQFDLCSEINVTIKAPSNPY
ncbi:hypothetical protein [Zobellia nedashkovskayae]|uniref:hypothetical protein n=1 Tax=Zobellia nedashkovskayae TaxID=2779510 RepID=UPI00188C7206|nr:hypothetical protein [Zobellia nedashkovskayae]